MENKKIQPIEELYPTNMANTRNEKYRAMKTRNKTYELLCNDGNAM